MNNTMQCMSLFKALQILGVNNIIFGVLSMTWCYFLNGRVQVSSAMHNTVECTNHKYI